MKATSTLCTAVFPDLGITLPAGVPTPIPDSAAAQVLLVQGVVVDEEAPAAEPTPEPPAPAPDPIPDTPAPPAESPEEK